MDGIMEMHAELDALQRQLHEERGDCANDSTEYRRDEIVSTILLVLIIRTDYLRKLFTALAVALGVIAALLVMVLVQGVTAGGREREDIAIQATTEETGAGEAAGDIQMIDGERGEGDFIAGP